MNELDGYKVQSDNKLYEGNLILIDELFQIYTCFYIQEIKGVHYLFKGKGVPVRPLEKHQYFILYLPNERDSEFLYDCYYGNRVSVPGYVEGIRIPLLDIQEKERPVRSCWMRWSFWSTEAMTVQVLRCSRRKGVR